MKHATFQVGIENTKIIVEKSENTKNIINKDIIKQTKQTKPLKPNKPIKLVENIYYFN